MVSKNNAKMVQQKMADQKQRFGIRKLSVGAASVLLGTVFYLQSGTVYADVNPAASVGNDSINVVNKNSGASSSEGVSSTSNSAGSDNSTRPVVSASDAGNSTATSQVSASPVKNTTSQVSNLTSAVSGQESSSSASQVNVGTDNIADGDNTNAVSRSASVPNSQASTSTGNTSSEQLSSTLSLSTNHISAVNASSLLVSKVALTGSNDAVNGGFDKATWGTLDVNAWKGSVQGDYYQLTDYTGDANHVIVPNEADFAKAGISTLGKQVGVTSDLMKHIFKDKATAQDATVAFSKTDNKQVKAINADWEDTWGHHYSYSRAKLSKFDGTNLDVSNVINMDNMFFANQISDLSSLTNWKIDNVKKMSYIFSDNSISDLSPLSNWKVDNVSDMSGMFNNNQISNLSPLAHWNVSNVINMSNMFNNNQISNLSPLAHWNVSNVIDMFQMFSINSISDLSPLVNWNITKVTDLGYMFTGNQISDLSPLVNWKVDNVENMSNIFQHNQIKDLSPLAKWHVNNVTDMSGMFENNQISDLSSLANWKTNHVTGMGKMFVGNQISDLSPLAKWNVDNVKNMSSLFEENQIRDLSPLANWHTNNVTDMNNMFHKNQISDLTPLSNWKVDNVKNMGSLFEENQIRDLSPLSNWKVDNVKNMGSLFEENQIRDLSPLANWHTNNVIVMNNMFHKNQISDLTPLAGWHTNNVGLFAEMFANNRISDVSPLANWNTDNVSEIYGIFDNNSSIQTKTTPAKRIINFIYPAGYTGKKQNSITQTIDVPTEKVKVELTTNKFPTSYKISDWVTKTETPISKITDPAYFQDYTVPEIKGLLEPDKTVIAGQQADITKPIDVTVTYKLLEFNTNDAFALNSKNGLHEHANVNDNGGYDTDFWGTLDVSKFTTVKNGDNLEITGYTGDASKVIIPNIADFEINNLDQGAKQVTISSDVMHDLAKNATRIGLSKTKNKKVVASNADWQDAFGGMANAPGTMSYANSGIKYGSPNLTQMDLHNLDTTAITNMHALFNGGSNLITVGDLSEWNTSNVTSMRVMFQTASSLTNIGNLDNWDTSEVTDMHNMFYDTKNLVNIGDLSNWDTSKVTDMSIMFANATNLANIGDLSKWDTSKVTDMHLMFANATNLANIGDLSKWDTSKVTDMNNMFADTNSLRHLNISNWNLAKLANSGAMEYMFNNDTDLTVIANDLVLPAWYQNEINGADYFWNNHMAVITNVPELIRTTGDIDNLKIDNQDASRSIFYQSNGSSDALTVLKQADQDYIKQYQQTHPGYALNLAATLDQTNPIALANAEFTSTANKRSVSVKFIDDQSFDGDLYETDYKKQVGQDITLTGRDGDTVDLKLTVPDKYQLADGQQLPTTYTFAKGSGDLKIHLVHKVVQREATADVQMGLVTAVRIDDGYPPFAVTQNQWTQLDDKIRDDGQPNGKMCPLVKVGILTGHVNYDLVDNQVVSFGDDWTTLNLGGQTYQMPDGTEVVNGIFIEYHPGSLGKSIKEELLKYHPDTDPDYANRPWHGYLSVNATNKLLSDDIGDSLQSGLVGNKPNTMAKANGDQAATAVKSANKTIDLSLLQHFDFKTRDFSEQNGRLQGIAKLNVGGVYIPYVEKTAIRTINVTTPDGKTTAVKQIATLAKQVDFSKDAHPAWTTGEWTNYDVPTIPGYTASQSQVAKDTVTGETKDQTVNITYTANDQSTHVNYVDAQGKLIHATTVNGQTGQTVKVSSEIPDGWKLVDGQTVPDTITFGPDGHEDMSVKIEHQHVTVTPDKPQANGAKLPDNSKQSFHDVEASDLNKTVTRTIKVTSSTGKTNTIKQEAKLTRTATVDEVTGDVSYGDWSIGQWDAYQVPSLNGYTATQPEVAATSVNESTKDQTVDVSYTPNKQSTVVKYVDDKGQVVHTTTVDGVTDQTVKVPNEVPAGWMITKGQVPSKITFGADGHEPIEVTVEHQHVTVDPTDPKNSTDTLPDNPAKNYPAGVSESDLNKTITRAIKITQPDGTATNKVQTVKLTRTADVDEVTGEVTYGKWTTGAWDAYEIPSAKGYTASQASVAAMSVTSDTKDQTVEVSYTANKQSTVVKYVDDKGQVVHTTTVNGVTDQTVKVPSEVPAGWMITKGKVPNEITFGVDGHEPIEIAVDHRHVTVDPAHPQTNDTKLPDNPAKTFEGVEANDLNKTITRTIKITQSDGQIKTVTQSVKLTRTADVDEVTGDVTYSNWSTGQWAKYDVPAVNGYTSTQTEIAAVSVNEHTTSQAVNVTYTPDAQKLSVKFIDDTTGQVLKTVTKTGVTNANAGYNTQSDIQSYEGQHYVLVSDSSNGANLVFDNDDNTDQAYEVHLKHGTHPIDEHHTITQTVHYIATDHASVPDDHTISIQFDRDGYHDEVTGDDHWNAWKQGDTQTLVEVPTPKKAGYTPDKLSVPATVVHPLDHNQTITVTYTPDTQKVIVTFIDDTDNGKTLKTVTKTGPTNSNAGYTTDDDISTYKGQHYVLVSDQTHGQSITFDTDTNADQRYEVHLKHGTHQISDRRIITETVHYKMTDGTTAPVDHTANIEFSRDGFNDEVTGTNHWNAWTPSATQQFDAVHSPDVKGYTPDVDQVNAVTVNPDSQSIERTVTYTPDAQKLDVTFIDDTTGKTLKTVVKDGVTNADANYNTKSDIQNFESQHYVLVSDSSKGAALVFDDDTVDQHYVVHLKHNTHAISEHHTVNETVRYQMSDGTKAPADYQAQTLNFSRDGFNDEVTGIDHWNAWAPKAEQTFGKVASPLVAGYTPDIDQINIQTVKPTDHDLEFTVTYTPNVQIAHVKYIDDTDHKVLTKDDLNGKTGETSGYHTTDRITEFKGQHYVFVSDNYPATGMTFDNNDRFDQIYEVHFTHGTRTDEQDVQVPRTIKYVYQNDQQAKPDHSDALSFHETKVVDLVDGHTVSDDWTPAQDFETVITPAIQGYTPDHASVSNTGIAHDHSAIVETVTYNPDAQKAVVKYIDDTTGEQLEAKDLAGVSDQSTGYTTNETIDGYINQHYVLVSDGTHGETVVFNHDNDADQSYEVHLKHGTEPANESRIKKITVHYQYADGLARSGKAADDQTVTNLTFKRTGTHDLVTDKIAWNAWDHADQTFSAIYSPVIDGYTPDRTVVDNVKVNPNSHDLTEVTVTYNADSQKLSVDFIDDTTGKTLKTVNKTGHSDESADYNTKSDIQDLISKHYDLTSDQTNGKNLVFDHDDNINQHYEVHLSHHTHQINEQHTVTETVHYQYADGLARSGKAADDFNANALKFSRDGFNDEVTGVDHWNAWTPSDQQIFDNVQSPVIDGYTPDQSEIGIINVVPTSQSIEKTVTYTADAQKLTVNFIDDVTGQTLKTVVKTGYSDGDAGYNTKADIQNFVGQHYDVVSDETKGADLVFDHNDSVDQAYDVHLTHHLTPISDHQVVNETIHYVYADGLARTGKAADDYTATPFEFNRTGKHDDVTGTDAWDAWIPGSASFAAVQSPVIQGYTPDHAQIDAVSVDANSQDIVKTVTYSADQQKMTIDFIDDTDNGKVLKTVVKTGGSDEAVGYNTKADIQTFIDGHYKLDHDTSNGENLVFDHDDATDQHYEVHLTHETAPITEATSTSQVIHYQLADGTPVATDYTAKVVFSRDGFKDLVTNADHWNAWTPNATQTFDAVMSPAKAGYTPDHAQVDAVTVEPHHADLETTVTYSPDAQKASVKYIDDVTGKTLQAKELTGVSDETSTYTTASTIKQYVGQHYKLVSDQTNGKPVAFDHDDDNDQTFVVHLAHTYQEVSQEHRAHQTIHYQYDNGKQAQPDYTATELVFSRTGIQDLVTENIQWNAWTPDQVFAAVNTPALNGYTPDVQTVAPVKVSHDSKDIEQTVIYHADDQTILVNYIDDDTHSTLKTDSIIGKTAQTSDYTTKKSLDQYKGQHYDLVSDDTNGDTLKFDSDSTKVQTYNVHLKHQHQTASDKSTVRQTVHYVYQDGKQAAKDHVATPIEFTRTGDTDLVTGKTTWNAWTPADGTFVAVLSPIVAGYTPSRAMIDHVDVHPGDKDLDTTVTYVPDRQVIVVNYIDQVTGKTLKTDILNGHSDQTSDYTTKSQIGSYIGQHYQLISDATKGQTLTFDHDDQATQTYDVVLSHQTEAAHRTHEVHETVDYVYADGSQASKSFTAKPLVFSQTGVHDLVTNITDWNGEWTKPQVFASVESPKITGFTAIKPEVKAIEVNHQSDDVHELVIYVANAQTAQIKYIDDVTGKTLEVDGANGHFNESIVFSHNVNDQINKFKQEHYKLVSNNFAGQKYQADNTKNVYEVHLMHEYQKVHATDAVAETVKFQYADGSQARSTKTQTVNFGRDGIKDLVTGTTAWMPVDSQTLDAVDVPVLSGYTADTNQVPAVKINFGDNDITKVVTYTANDQVAEIKIIDDTTGNVLNTQSATGKFGTEIQFKQNPDQQVIDLQAQHYELVSDNFNGQKYQADNAKNQFEIHVKHQMMDVQRTDKVTETVRYQDTHGNMLHPVTIQTKMFTEHGITDQVTGKTVWTPAKSQTMDAVSAPEITGYTHNKQSVPATSVNFGDKDINDVIVYAPVSEAANIKYINDTTGKTLLSDQTTGDFGSQIKFDHDPVAQINQYEGQGYKLVSNSYGNTAHQFSATQSENNFEVHFKHDTMPVSDTDKVTETIHYLRPDGNKLTPDKTQTITFTRHGVKDQVTDHVDWNPVEPQEFNAVKSPVIDGYQADAKVVDGRKVLFGDQDVVINIHYTKLPEQKQEQGQAKQPGINLVNTYKVTPEKVVTVANGTVQKTKQNTVKNSTQDTNQLPQTGSDEQANLLSIIGGSLMTSLALFGLDKKKKHKN